MSVSIGDSPHARYTRPADPIEVAVQSERSAREAVQVARDDVAEAVREEREAFKVAGDFSRKLALARGRMQKSEAELDGLDSGTDAYAAVQEELDAAKQEAAELEVLVGEADALVSEWQQYRDSAEERLDDAKHAANSLLKSLGKDELYRFSSVIRDTFQLHGGEFLKRMAKLLGTQKPLPPEKSAPFDARRIALATDAHPANGAQLLAQLLQENDEPAYHQTLVSDALLQAMRMGAGLSDLLAGEPAGEEAERAALARSLLAGVSQAVARMGPAVAWPLVESFAEGVRDEDPRGLLESWLREVLMEWPVDLCFAVELAVALYGSGKTAAADEVVSAIHHALAEARASFVQRAAQAASLDAGLVRSLPGFAQGRRAEELEQQLRVFFKEDHVDAYEERESAARTLGAMLNGAALAVTVSQAGGLPSNALTGALLEQSVFAIGLADRVLETDAGQWLLGETIELQAQECRTFLDVLPDANRVLGAFQSQSPGALAAAGLAPERFSGGGALFLAGIQQALSRFLVPHLLMLRGSGHLPEALEVLRSTVERNPGLFGVSDEDAAGACGLFATLAQTLKPLDAKRVLLGLAKVEDSTLKALGMVVALSNLLVLPSSQASAFAEALRTSAPRLLLGARGLGVLCCLFEPLRSPRALAQVLGNARQTGMEVPSCLGAKVMGAFSTVVVALASESAPALPLSLGALLPVVSRASYVESLVTGFVQGLKSKGAPRASGGANVAVFTRAA